MSRSNGFAFQIIDAAPLNEIGWEVQVIHQKDFDKLCDPRGSWVSSPVYDPSQQYSARNLFIQPLFYNRFRPLATLSRFQKLTLMTEISGVGAGSIELDIDDEFFSTKLTNGEPATTLLEYEHLFHVYENGALRGAFLGQVVEEVIVPDSDGVRTIRISGPGPADVLRWGKILTPYFPNAVPIPTNKDEIQEPPYTFKRVTHMGAWLILLADAKKRGTLGFVCPGFTDEFDSGGNVWPDQPLPPPDPNIIAATLSSDVFFYSDSHTLTERAQSELAGVAQEFDKMTAPHVTIVGHTDSTNNMAYNQALSERRARSVGAFIKSKVPQVVLHMSGKGETQPVATNKTVRGREKNRRVTITYPQQSIVTAENTLTGPVVGNNLLQQLEDWIGLNVDQVSPLRAEYIMLPNFKLQVRIEFGTHREKYVIFYEGSTNVNSRNRERRRAEIQNWVAALVADGSWVLQTDPTSVNRFRQRENYVPITGDFTDAVRTDVASATLQQTKTETTTWSLVVPPYAEGRRVYEDYNLGDWIGVSRYLGAVRNTVEPFRILAIACEVDSTGQTKMTSLTLQSKDESYLAKLKARLTNLLGGIAGTQVFIQDAMPPNAKVGDLWTPLNPER